MLTVYDSRNQPYVLAKRLGSGGEGEVYACENDSHTVAKIYHEPATQEKAEKLRWMARHRDERLGKIAAWVIDVLMDAPGGEGNIVGFLMPNIRAKEIHELYSLKSRRVHFPDATWHFLIHTAANVARAFYALHKNGHVMGDVNHGNCVVLADGTVKLIDCDSYSIKTENFRYPCEVGVATHLAPELQGVNLRAAEREINHDNFGLAVIIFQLLFLGRHPFAGNFLGGEDKPIEECIREHLFAYGETAARKRVAQPPGTLPLEAVSYQVAKLFERAFTSDYNRPTAREWIEALEDLSNSLEQCSLNPGHLFYEKNALCSWCEIESQTGLMLFPFITASSQLQAKYKKPFDLITVENLLESFDIKPNLPVSLSANTALAAPKPAPQIVGHCRDDLVLKAVVCLVYLGCLFPLYYVATFNNECTVCVGFLSIVAVSAFYRFNKDKDKEAFTKERERLYELEYKWNVLEKEWRKVAVSPALQKDLVSIKEKIEDYRKIQPEILQNSQSDLPAIAEGKPKNSLAQEVFAETSRKLEQEIGELLGALRAQSVKLRGRRRNLLAQSKKIANDLPQTQINVRYIDNRIPLGLLLIIISIATPILAFSISAMYTKPFPPSNTPPYDWDSTYKPLPPRPVVAIPNEKITDQEIAAMTAEERDMIVNDLIGQSNQYVKDGAYDLAEGRLKFALRFDNENTAVLNALGDLYYVQKKFDKELEYLKRSKEIRDSEETNFLIGMTYISLQRYKEARDTFKKLIDSGVKNNECFYNLGLAYQGLNQHRLAADAFQQALSLKADDTDTIYQMAISFSKLRDENAVRFYYRVLKEKDFSRAAQLKNAIGKSINLDIELKDGSLTK